MSSPIGIRVPDGGSCCAKCEYVAPKLPQCLNRDYIRTRYRGKTAGDPRFIDGKTGHPVTDGREFCCNFFDWRAT